MKYFLIIIGFLFFFKTNQLIAQNIDLKADLLAFYPFEGNVKDKSSNYYHLNNYGVTFTNDRYGKKNSACKFNANSYMDVGLDFPQNGFSISFWVKKLEEKNQGDILGWDDGALGFIVSAKRYSSNILCGINGNNIASKAGMEANKWYHYAITMNDTGALKFFIDGKLETVANVQVPVFSIFRIGKSSNNNNFKGKIDDVFIYSRELSFAEVQALKNNQFEYDNKSTYTNRVIMPYADIDKDIPEIDIVNNNVYALIIGNENYKSERIVPYARRDAYFFKEYLVKTLGIPKANIELKLNAMYAEMQQSIKKLSLYSKSNPDAQLIFYYSGHGLPDENTRIPYMLPIEARGTDLEYAVNMNKVYATLTQYEGKRATVFLDACFSGSLDTLRGVKIKPKNQLNNNLVVFTSSSGTQPSTHYRSKKHGTFTYYLLKKLQQTQGNITYEELGKYLKKEVGITVNSEWSREQTPNIILSGELKQNNQWKTWKFVE